MAIAVTHEDDNRADDNRADDRRADGRRAPAEADGKWRSTMHRRQRYKNLALLLVLLGLVALFYAITIVRLGGSVLDRAL